MVYRIYAVGLLRPNLLAISALRSLFRAEIRNRSGPVLIHFFLGVFESLLYPPGGKRHLARERGCMGTHTVRISSLRMDADGYNSIFFHVF